MTNIHFLKSAVVGLCAAVGLAACATTQNEPVDTAAQALLDTLEPTGETRSCIPLSGVRQIRPVTESKFLVRVRVRDYYLSEMNGRCGGATRQQTRLQYRTSLNQLCSNEIVNIIDNTSGIFVGSCSFGVFKELQRKEEAE